ncbi:flagellar basal body rod protein FlgC [Shewanella chilikensis]|uniref:flagellar basal body rod protein FlgC n=1 Tax=Shewanella chilikensis TaxID=558541 RepID=UPI001F462FED|nr:flagellar basal body rod protein FlgC [Shewanella chilikensis]MCE9787503.1 flagellar basal body rod protein FlgC [Shewanella chilikensis]
MSFAEIYQVAGSGMTVQTLRLNAIASNLANAGVAAESSDNAYRAIKPVFATLYQQQNNSVSAKVQIKALVQSDAPLETRYEPGHPLANADGYVTYSNVNTVEEMADMMAASRAFETSVEVMNRARSMQQGLLALGK